MSSEFLGGVKNLTRTIDPLTIAREAQLRSGAAMKQRVGNPLEGHDLGLFVDGARVSLIATHVEVEGEECGESTRVRVSFSTTVGALRHPDINASMSAAWGGYATGDIVQVRAPGKPMGGTAQILELQPSKHEGERSFFRVRALTAIHDWTLQGDACGSKIAEAQDELLVDTQFVARAPAGVAG